ncbi:carboxymuconolactone decarboxylase family protein NDAI_0J00470 [Naumovozyma dairenensis CBS 421]|uniref:Uncharacterized protein n=1 Tax=Naumovozyma dairenensis (strain ATCC 10597 / BCRC 20456 / CBS 421 / NBRC 0211 / NRRL Y-12639) TaxID=1071378 RepID=G0WGL1_NAUDC|nr:hypothetical protein NDAI_0J00470 [Naumovozyma dairenensis CBS 421]CCD26939.1 hypothetical protein NDAI_0J00470 [Naumovozyma dairenensis CBS 421]
MVLTKLRLIEIVNSYDTRLKHIWYLVVIATFCSSNQPNDIAIIYLYVMLRCLPQYQDMDVNELSDCVFQLFDRIDTENRLEEINRYFDINKNNFDNSTIDTLRTITDKFKETLLKCSAICGLPKCINGLTVLKSVTPTIVLDNIDIVDPYSPVNDRDSLFARSSLLKRGKSADVLENDDINNGIDHWNLIYNKVSSRVANNLNQSYPDLWYFIIKDIYGSLLSNNEVLNNKETSIIVISSLIPQDVNAQLKGHLRGALNVGCTIEIIKSVRELSILCCKWCNINWQTEISKL